MRQLTFGRRFRAFRAFREIKRGILRDLDAATFNGIIIAGLAFGRWFVTDMLRDLMLIAAILLISYGAWLVYKPAGYVSAGVILLCFGSLGIIRGK